MTASIPSNSGSVNDVANVSGAATATANATTIAAAKTSTCIVADVVATTVVALDGIMENNGNNAYANKSDSFISSPPHCGKKQKQDVLNQLPTSPSTNALKLSPKNKQPKPCVCCWKHCPFPCIGQCIVHCTEDGCGVSMHKQCLYEFENDTGYEYA
jgi:hypothetical protein